MSSLRGFNSWGNNWIQAIVQQYNPFLASMGMNEDDYKQLLKQSHMLMREEAEAERNLLTS